MHEASKKQDDEALYVASQWRLMRIKFARHRLARLGGTVVVLFYLVAILAEFIAPYDPRWRDIGNLSLPPARIRIVDESGKLRAPFVYAPTRARDPVTLQAIYTEDRSRRYAIRIFARGDSYKLWGLFRSDLHLFGVEENLRAYFLGGDEQGRDLLSRIMYGTRISLSIGFVGVALSFGIGIVMGAISGYFGGVADVIIQRVIEVLLSIPSLPLWMALSAGIPLDWSIYKVFFAITLILSLISWPGLARVVRGQLLSLRSEEFVIAAKVSGATENRVMFRHLVPSFLSYIIALSTLAIPGMILGETSLSFLGIGLQPPAISYGTLLKAAQNVKTVMAEPWLLIPGLFVVVIILSFNFLGDGLRDAADPYK